MSYKLRQSCIISVSPTLRATTFGIITQNILSFYTSYSDKVSFYFEVIEPLKKGEAVGVYACIHPDFVLEYRETIEYKKLHIIEGSYSCHPYFDSPYKLQIFVEAGFEVQVERIRKRNGEVMLQRFINELIPKENEYFRKMKIKENCLQIKK